MPKHIKLVARLTILLSLLAIGFVFSTGNSPVHAQTLTPHIAASIDNHTCIPARGTVFTVVCQHPNITTFCSGTQFFSTTDGLGNPIDWTFSDSRTHCVTVDYRVSSSFSNCTVLFYVPEGNATANFVYTWTDKSGGQHQQSLNENNFNGWVQIISTGAGMTDLSFIDLQSTGGLQIGWGSSVGHSLQVTCS